jgi:hypothetical protein
MKIKNAGMSKEFLINVLINYQKMEVFEELSNLDIRELLKDNEVIESYTLTLDDKNIFNVAKETAIYMEERGVTHKINTTNNLISEYEDITEYNVDSLDFIHNFNGTGDSVIFAVIKNNDNIAIAVNTIILQTSLGKETECRDYVSLVPRCFSIPDIEEED